MTLHPLVMNTTPASGNTVRGTATTAKPSLTITHVGNERSMTGLTVNHQRAINERSNTGQQTVTSSTVGHSHHQQQQQQQPHQIAQIVNLNQPGINVGHGHQIVNTNRINNRKQNYRINFWFPFPQQIIGSQGTQQSSTVVPLTITSRAANASVNSLPASVSQIVRANVNLVTAVSGASNNMNSSGGLPPIAKVIPQQQQQSHSNEPPPMSVSSVGNTQNVYIHSRSPSNPTASGKSRLK